MTCYNETMNEYDYTTYGSNVSPEATEAAAQAVVLGTAIGFAITAIAVILTYVLLSWFGSVMFKKAGIQPWIAWVPFYNLYTFLKLGGQPGFWGPLYAVPFVNYVSLVFLYIAAYHVGLKFGRSGAFVVMAIFLPVIWLGMIAFSKDTWQGEVAAAPVAPPAAPTPLA